MIRRRRLILAYFASLICFGGLAYSVLYSHHKGLRFLAKMSDSELKGTNGTGDVNRVEDSPYFYVDEPHEGKLEDCLVWVPLYSLQSDDRDSFLTSCSVESALLSTANMEGDKVNVCLLLDRFEDTAAAMENGSQDAIKESEWYKALRAKYTRKIRQPLQLLVPDYAAVFAGTLFEEVYINSADLSDLRPAVIWSLLWKYAGLLLSPDTLLFPSFKTYFNFLTLNKFRNESVLNIMQFVDRHQELPGKALHHLMEQAISIKNNAIVKEQENLLRVSVKGISDNLNIALSDITQQEWTEEVESFCGEELQRVNNPV